MEQAASALAGTTFCPTHTEIIECLHRLSTGSELHSVSSYITFANVYSAAPYNLVAQHAQPASSGHEGPYYFLSPVHDVSATRKSRAVDGTDGKGRWHTEAGRKRVEATAGGYMSKFSYQEKTSFGTTKPGAWLMVEYCIDGWDDVVIAKIYRSPRRQATNVPPSYMASSSTAVTMSLQEIERFLMSDGDAGGAVGLVESQQAVLANDYPDFINNDNGSHGALQYLSVAGQYNVSGAATAAHGATQFLAGQYNVSGAAAAAHGATQYLAGQYNVSGAAATAHGATQFLAGQYNVSGAAAAVHGATQFLAGQYLAWEQHVAAAAAAPGPGQAGAAHYLAAAAAAALQVSPGHADHANMVVLGHNQTVLGAGYEVQGQVAQHRLIPEPAIVGKQRMLADDVVIQPHIASTSGSLANLELDADLYAW